MNICLQHETGSNPKDLLVLAKRWGFTNDDQAIMALILTSKRLELRKRDEAKLGRIYVDFTSSTMTYRRRFGGGHHESIAKAIGIKKNYLPTVVDATAGLGRDAFLLASLGCSVHMLERHSVVAALLDDGLQRGYQNSKIGSWLREYMTLLHVSSVTYLANILLKPDVVYLDPMYPRRQKSALAKKEMHIFHSLVGTDDDADSLLSPARKLAVRRVVVKRPSYAKPLANIAAQAKIITKNHRFDLYFT